MTHHDHPFILPPDHNEETEKGIFFQTEDIDLELNDPDRLIRWIETVIAQENRQLHALQYIFCSDAYLHRINLDYLNHDTLTDVITFSYADLPLIQGDIFISIDRIRDNAQQLKLPFSDELHRVIIHGVLHLCGYGDKSPAEKLQMSAKEEEALRLLRSA